MSEKLNIPFKKKWVAALKSGKYIQISSEVGFGHRACVLGVGGYVKNGKNMTGYRIFKDKYIETELFDLNDSGVPFEILAGIINEYL